MFFKSLYEVAKHTALSMIITPQGARLRVIIMPKPGKDAKEAAALSKPIEAIGTPEELDAELPKAIADYAGKVNDLRAAISVPTEALDAAKAKAGKPKPAKKPKPPKAAKKPRPPKRVKAAKPAKVAKPKSAPKPKPPVAAAPRMPGAGKKIPTPRASLPGKDHCLEDLVAYIATGKDLNRAAFIAWARKNGNKSGRRFEKLWKGWHEFIADGKTPGSGAPQQLEVPPSSLNTASSSASSRSAAAASDSSGAKMSKTSLNPAAKWPFPTGTRPEEAPVAVTAVAHIDEDLDSTLADLEKKLSKPAPSGSSTAGHVRTVFTDTGLLLGNSDEKLAIGDKFSHQEFGDFRLVKIEDDRYTVQRFPDATAETQPAAKAGPDLFVQQESPQS